MNQAEQPLPRDQIIHLYCVENIPITLIAEKFGVSRQAIYFHLDAAGVETRPRKRKVRTLEYQSLYSLYVEEKLPVYKIRSVLKASSQLIERELERYKIERRQWQYRSPFPSEIDSLQIGDSCIIARQPSRVAYCGIYLKAGLRGMKVSIRKVDPSQFRVTRIA